MSASVLVNGVLFKVPESRVSKAGNAFVMATLNERAGTEFRFWRVFAFADTARAELERLGEGDSLSAQGSFEAKVYECDSKATVSLSITADMILALRQPAKPRAPRERSSGRAPANRDLSSNWQAPAGPDGPPPPYDDPIDF